MLLSERKQELIGCAHVKTPGISNCKSLRRNFGVDVRGIVRNRQWQLLVAAIGGISGFAYYYFIGCRGASCPISGNPWISTGWGALIGWLAVPQRGKISPNPEKGEKN